MDGIAMGWVETQNIYSLKENWDELERYLEWNILLDEEGTPVPEDFSRPEALQVEVLTGYKYLFNVGSIGQPRNRDPRASFAVFDNVERTVTRYRLPYDVATAQQKVLDAGLPERLALRLATGS